MSYTDFKNKVLGKGFDVDGYYGAQCWDGFAYYSKYLGFPSINCTVTGYVEDLWEQRHSNGILKYFDEVENMQAGDVAIFKEDSNWTPLSHVAIFDSDIDGEFGWFLGQNQNGAYYPNGGSCFNLTKLPYSATYPTAFRPKVKVETKKGDTFMATGKQDAKILIFDDAMDGFKKGGYYLFNFARGTYNWIPNPEALKYIRKQFPNIQEEHTNKAYPVYKRYIQGAGLVNIDK